MSSKTIYTFHVQPATLAVTGDGPDDVKSIGIIELSMDAEQQSSKRANNDMNLLGRELAMTALVRVNGKEVSVADGSADKAFRAMHPKIRTLVVSAYNLVNLPKAEETNAFLGSMEVSIE